MTLPFAPEYGVPYTLTGPDGSVAVFNDTTSPNYVGSLTNISGLDSPEVRESGEAIVAFDGGVQGPGYFGRRPVVIEGLCYNHGSASARNVKLNRLMTASRALRADAILSWTPSGGVPVQLALRTQQPLRIEGAWNKTFQASFVAADPRIYSASTNQAYQDYTDYGGLRATSTPTNLGTAETFPKFWLGGPLTTAGIVNSASPMNIKTVLTLALNDVLVVDTQQRTVLKGTRAGYLRKNLFTTPSFEGGFNDLASVTNGSMAIVAQPTPSSGMGTSVLRVTSSTSVSNANILTANLTGVASGNQVIASVSALAAATPRSIAFMYDWYTAANAFISTTASFTSGVDATGSWTRIISPPVIAPGTAAKVAVTTKILSPLSGEIHYFDGLVVEVDTGKSVPNLGTYFDGGRSDSSGQPAMWDGTANHSTSTILDTTLGTGALVPVYASLDFTNTVWGGLVPGPQTISWSGTGFSNGTFLVTQWRDAWL